MKNNSGIILSLFLIKSLLNVLNSEIVPVGSTIYYSRNNKCAIYREDSKICLNGQDLYNKDAKILTIGNYLESNYYELNLFQTHNDYINCIITHFLSKNKLEFKYYNININNNAYEEKDYTYYNVSLKPLNKGINCQAKDEQYQFICFYLNNNKDVVKMDIKPIDNTYKVSIDFQVSGIYDSNVLNRDDTIIMSSLFMDKYKFFYPEGKFDFSIYVKQATEFDFTPDSFNSIRQFKFDKNDNHNKFTFFNFAIFKANSLSQWNDNLNEHAQKILFFVLENRNSEVQKKYNNIIPSLIFENKINILFLKINGGIKDFEIEEIDNELNTDEYNNIISSDKGKKIKKINNINKYTKKEEILVDIDKIMDEVNIGETFEYQNDDFNLLIYPINSELLKNKTHIDSFQCESDLKNYYNLSNESIITFFQMEITNENEKSLINQVEYQVYDEKKNKLNLSKCNNTNIKIIYGINQNSNLDMSVLNSFKDSEVNVFNISDDFFNDICYPYSENGNDLILEDRIKDIYQDFTLCEEGCYFDKIDINNMLISCQCNIKENITTEIKEINDEKVVEKITSLNFEIIKCYNLAFSFKGKMKNYGFWIFSVFFLFYFIFLISFSCNGIRPIKDYIFNEMTKFGYMSKKSSKHDKFSIKGKRNIKRLETNNSMKNRKKLINPPKKEKSIELMTSKKSFKTKNKGIINNIQITNQVTNKKTVSFTNNKYNNKIKNLDLNLISINLNNLSQRDITPKESNITLYNYSMKEAFKYDRRNILVIFYIYLLSKEAFFHAFFYKSPLVLFPLRFCLILFIISSDLALNAFFYFNDNISRKYRNTKNIFIFTLSNNMTVILLSTLITFIFLTLFTNLSNTTKDLRDVFKNEENKIRKNKNYQVTQTQKDKIKKNVENVLSKYKCKIFFLFFIEIILMLFFWYYTVVFCHVFSGTQISWLINSALSMISRIIIDVLLCLLFAKLYRIGVRSNYACIYKIALFFYGF